MPRESSDLDTLSLERLVFDPLLGRDGRRCSIAHRRGDLPRELRPHIPSSVKAGHTGFHPLVCYQKALIVMFQVAIKQTAVRAEADEDKHAVQRNLGGGPGGY